MGRFVARGPGSPNDVRWRRRFQYDQNGIRADVKIDGAAEVNIAGLRAPNVRSDIRSPVAPETRPVVADPRPSGATHEQEESHEQ